MNKPEQYLLDSSFIISLLDGDDIHHQEASHIFDDIRRQDAEIFFSDIIINETLSVFARRSAARDQIEKFSVLTQKFRSAIKDFPILCLYELVPKHYGHIISIIVKNNGVFSFHDAMIILFLEDVPNVGLVTFDKDFQRIERLKITPRHI